MKIDFKKAVFLVAFFLYVTGAYAQQIKIPFELSKDNKAIFIKLPMENQKDSLTFFFDTGANATLLDKKIADKYNLKPNYKTEISGAGGEKTHDVLTNQKLFIDRNHFVDSTHIVLGDLSRFNSLSEKKFDGIIGAVILKDYITEIDFQTRTMNLYKFTDPMDYNGYEKIPFDLDFGIPKFPITFQLKNKEKFSGDILFDSGAGLTLLVNTPYKEKNRLSEKMDRKLTYNSHNLSGKSSYEKGLIESIQLGNTTFSNKNLRISLASDKKGVSSSDEILGILGSEIINRFNFILDYKTKNLYLKPNHLFDKDFEALISPISLKYSEDRKEIIISNVLENTDAFKAGLKEGQKIISIDNTVSNDIETYMQLLKQKNKTVIIKYEDSNNEIRSATITLKELL